MKNIFSFISLCTCLLLSVNAFAGAMDRARIQFDLIESFKSLSPQDAINSTKDILSRKNAAKISYLAGMACTQPAYTTEEYLVRHKDAEFSLKLSWKPLTLKASNKIEVTYSAVLSYPAQPNFAGVGRTIALSPGETLVVTDAETAQGMKDTRPIMVAIRADPALAQYAYPKLGGIGAGVQVRSGTPVITNVTPGSAAEKAGLCAGDELREIDGRTTVSLRLEDLVRLIKGDPGTIVVLQVFRPAKKTIEELSIIRDMAGQE